MSSRLHWECGIALDLLILSSMLIMTFNRKTSSVKWFEVTLLEMVAKKVQFPSNPACCNMHVWLLSDSIFFCSNFYPDSHSRMMVKICSKNQFWGCHVIDIVIFVSAHQLYSILLHFRVCSILPCTFEFILYYALSNVGVKICSKNKFWIWKWYLIMLVDALLSLFDTTMFVEDQGL